MHCSRCKSGSHCKEYRAYILCVSRNGSESYKAESSHYRNTCSNVSVYKHYHYLHYKGQNAQGHQKAFGFFVSEIKRGCYYRPEDYRDQRTQKQGPVCYSRKISSCKIKHNKHSPFPYSYLSFLSDKLHRILKKTWDIYPAYQVFSPATWALRPLFLFPLSFRPY